MPYTVTSLVTKPSNTAFWAKTNGTAAQRLADWTKAQPGVVASTATLVTADTWQTITTFQSQADWSNYQTAAASNADYQARDQYKTANGQTTVLSFAS